MSLPATHKDISSSPSKMGVSSPTDPAVKAADIDRKMKIYGIFEAFRQGKYPSNRQIEETLQYVLNTSPIDQSKLSRDGKELIRDAQSIIDTAREMVAQKNADELFQNFLYATRHVDNSKLNPANSVGVPISKDEASQHGDEALENLKTLGKLIFTNSEFRKLLKDVGLIARDVAADAAVKAAETARPDGQALQQVDEPAPANQWVHKDGSVRGPNDPVPDTGLAEKKDQAIDAKNQAVNQASDVKNQAQAHGQESRDRVQNAAQSAPGDSSSGPSDAQTQAGRNEAQNVKDEKAGLAKSKFNELKAKIPDEHKDKAREMRGRVQNYADEKFPEERRDRFIYRLKKVIVEQQRHRDYQDAIDFFLNMAETYTGHAKNIAGQTGQHTANVHSDPAFSAAQGNLRVLLERFANGQSMQPIFDATNQIYVDAQNDPELRRWFSELDTYVRKVLQEPGYVMRDSCDQEGRRLQENGQGFFNERYRPHREAFVNSVQNFFQAYADDPLNVQFGEDWKRLTRDLALDSEGNLAFKPHLWQDIRSVIIPGLAQHIGYVPIPRIEYTDNQIDLVIENLTLESQNIIPNLIEMEARNFFKLSPYSNIEDQSKHSFWISFSQVQADLRDVAFYYKKKKGFPKISDSGLADVVMAGKGISGKIHLESTGRRNHAFFVREVKITVDTLKFKVRDAKHTTMYNMIRPLATGLIKKQVTKAIEDGIRNALEQVDAQLSDIKERLDDASGRDDISRTDVVKDVFSRKKQNAEETAKEVDAKTGTFKIVGQRDSKILEWSSKNSLVEKQGQQQELANATNHGWKSPAFDIVPTSSIKSGNHNTNTSSAKPLNNNPIHTQPIQSTQPTSATGHGTTGKDMVMGVASDYHAGGTSNVQHVTAGTANSTAQNY